MKNNRKYVKGITLISLIITIILLIILTGVAIYLSLGNNGIFVRSKEAREASNKQTATEKINLKITTAQMNKYAEKQEMPTLKELSLILKEDSEIEYVIEKEQESASAEYNVPSENPSSIFTKLNEYPYEFEINGSLQLASINGIKIATTGTNNNNNSVYSNSEQIVGTWINNKPIYRKVFTVSENVKAYENVRYIRKIVTEGVDDIIDTGGYFILNDIKRNFGSSEINWKLTPSFHSYAWVNANNLELYILYNSNNYKDNPITGTIWIEYTKNTD